MQHSFTQITPKPDPVHGKPCRRSSHGVSILDNGSLLVVYGGEHVARTPLVDKESLWFAVKEDNDEWQWQCILPTDTKPPARVAHAQAVVGDSSVYIFGGRAGITMKEKAMNDLYKLDTTTRQWKLIETKGTPPVPRSFHRMISIENYLYVFGGCSEQGRMADLHQLDLFTLTWSNLGTSPLLQGRGGPNLLQLNDEKLAVVAGFAGEETNDGHVFCLKSKEWAPQLIEGLGDMRPRSVNVAGSSSKGCIIVGGEVDPSAKGHEGAGGFTNDVVVLDSTTGDHVQSLNEPNDSSSWPEARGWSDGSLLERSDGNVSLFIFGGLSGDDSDPIRLDDLWRLDISFS